MTPLALACQGAETWQGQEGGPTGPDRGHAAGKLSTSLLSSVQKTIDYTEPVAGLQAIDWWAEPFQTTAQASLQVALSVLIDERASYAV